MKVIFLDFDGVLNTTSTPGSWTLHAEDALLADKVALVNKIIDATGARVVISSMWRIDTSIAQLQKLLDKKGFTGVVIGKTPDNKDERWKQIAASLVELDGCLLGSTKFVIIDDSLIAGWGFSKNFVNTNPDDGLTDTDANRAIRILNGSDYITNANGETEFIGENYN